ncbi:unnamed protein product [Phytophthora fragariaefolia]|uniref:Unnamed protein product n=1 Tax=Phytophthora fragariaefolia TaxID=1490495 RepID=A0A9W7D320_9STRA|nr:unnamed protein product [Phytophthora fragariaefolia]
MPTWWRSFWAEAAMTAIYIKNRLPSPKSPDKNPFEIVYKAKPNVKHMRIFGCKAYVLTPKEKRLKWDPKAREGIFLGYEERSKAYRVYDIEAGQVVISRDVTFDESSFDGSKGIDDEDVDGVTDYFDDMQVSDDSGTRVFTQAGKRKSRAEHEDRDNVRRPRRTAGLEEASAPDHADEEPQRESSPQEEKAEDNGEDKSTSPMFWRASGRGGKLKPRGQVRRTRALRNELVLEGVHDLRRNLLRHTEAGLKLASARRLVTKPCLSKPA